MNSLGVLGMLLCRLYYHGLIINISIPFMQLNSHNALFNKIQLNRLKCLFVRGGQNWSFCRYWNNGVDECVGSCLPVICDVRKERRICRHFYSSSTHFVLAACKVCAVFFQNLEVRLLISTKRYNSSARKAEQLARHRINLCLWTLLCRLLCVSGQTKTKLNCDVMKLLHKPVPCSLSLNIKCQLLSECIFECSFFWMKNNLLASGPGVAAPHPPKTFSNIFECSRRSDE